MNYDKIDAELEFHSRVIAASEDWADGYKDSPEQLADLIKAEASLETKLRRYFRELAKERVENYVIWSHYNVKVLQAYDVNVIVNDDVNDEVAIIMNILIDDVAYMMEIGATAGAYVYSTPTELNRYSEKILETARKESAKLAKGINETTRKQISKALEASIALGEDSSQAAERLRKIVGNPYRAELIAKTESVRAFSQGTIAFGKESGAVSKTWETVRNACRICAPLKGETVPITELFGLMNGNAVMGPPGHPRCRCRLVLNYEDE